MELYKKLFEDSIPVAPAYWINPSGKILPIYADETHIDQVLKKPSAFGLDIDEIKALHKAEGEHLGDEGKAREKIIIDLINQGWIRIRHYPRKDMFSINVNKLSDKNKEYIYDWVVAMQDKGLKHSDITLDTKSDGVIRSSVGRLASEVLFAECKKRKKSSLVLVESVQDFSVKEVFEDSYYSILLENTDVNNKITTKATQLKDEDILKLKQKDVNMTYFEIDAQIHGIKNLKNYGKENWDTLKLDDIFFEYNSLRKIAKKIYFKYGEDILQIWEKNLIKRMDREKLLGKNMKNYIDISILKENYPI